MVLRLTVETKRTNEAVIVLQTSNEKIATQMIRSNQPLTINGTETTRQIVAGLAMSQGLLPPFKKYSTVHNHVFTDLSWSIGNHPFSPTSNCDSLSEIQIDAINRIAILSRLNKAIQVIKQIVKDVDSFGSVSFLSLELSLSLS